MQEQKDAGSLLCGNLHGTTCEEPLEEGYEYCPMCGTLAAEVCLRDAAGSPPTLNLPLRPEQTSQKIYLVNRGPANVSIETNVTAPGVTAKARRLAVPGVSNGAPGRQMLSVDFDPHARQQEGCARLTLTTATGVPDLEDPWQKRRDQTTTATLAWHLRSPARLEILTPALLFHARDGRAALLRIRNAGDEDLPLDLPLLPSGFVFGTSQMLPSVLGPGQPLSLTVFFRGEALRASRQDVIFDTPSGFSSVQFITEREQAGGVRPDWIIAIDFGTSNTSVVVRSIPRNGLPAEDGECYALGANGGDRFPSAMLYNARERTWTFGKDAEDKSALSDPEHFLIDDRNSLKMKLSESGEPYFLDEWVQKRPVVRGEMTIAALLRTYLHHLKDTLIAPFLNQQQDDIHAQYVLSLPVLDNVSGERYERQRARMLAAFSQVFDTPEAQILTELEPNCAANHLLIGQGYAYLEKLIGRTTGLFNAGERFVVVDSGGGTTDIAYGEFEENSLGGGRLQFRVVRNLGLDEERKPFGGREVSDFLHQRLNTVALGKEIEEGYFHRPCQLLPLEASKGLRSCNAISATIEAAIKPTYGRGATPEGLPEGLVAETQAFVTGRTHELLTAMRNMPVSPGYQRKHARWVFLVGGNTLIHSLQSYCLDKLAQNDIQKLPDLPPEERFLAVAKGAAYVDGLFAPTLAPYSVILETIDANGNIATTTLQAKHKPLVNTEHYPNFEGAVQINLRADDDTLVRQTVGATGLTTRVTAELRAGRLLLLARLAGVNDGQETYAPPEILFDGKL